MNREEQLDYLIQMRQQDEAYPAETNNELMGRLAVAEMLTRYQETSVPEALAEHIERQVRAHIQQQTHRSLSAHLLASTVPPAGHFRHTHRLLKPLLSVAALLVLLCVATLAAAAYTLPGDPLYGMKQAENQFLLLFADSPSARAEDLIGQVQIALNDLEAVVMGGRSPQVIQQALNAVAFHTNNAQASVTTVPAGSARKKIQHDLTSALGTENHTLRGLLNRVNWSLRVALTHQLGTIGQVVPAIEQVGVLQQNNGTLMITVTGRNVAPQARLVVNGQLQGGFRQRTATQFVCAMSQNNWRDDTQMIGVLNPDGTATEIRVVFHVNDDHQQQEGGDDHGGRGGPGKSAPTPGDDHNGSGKGRSGGEGSDG